MTLCSLVGILVFKCFEIKLIVFIVVGFGGGKIG